MTSERAVTRFKRGRPYKAWAPRTSSVRCEVWDTTVYALAALHSLYVSGLRLADAAAMIENAPLKASLRPGQGIPLPAGPGIIRSRFMEQGLGGEQLHTGEAAAAKAAADELESLKAAKISIPRPSNIIHEYP